MVCELQVGALSIKTDPSESRRGKDGAKEARGARPASKKTDPEASARARRSKRMVPEITATRT